MNHGEGQRLTRRISRSRFDEARFLRPGQQAGSTPKKRSRVMKVDSKEREVDHLDL